MARLSIRVKFNEGRIGVPLAKLGNVVGAVRQFLGMLAEDVEISGDSDWQGFGFENKSLSFVGFTHALLRKKRNRKSKSSIRLSPTLLGDSETRVCAPRLSNSTRVSLRLSIRTKLFGSVSTKTPPMSS